MTTAYVDIDYVKLVGTMPAADVDAVEALYPGVVTGLAVSVSSRFDATLRKRYAAPFAAPFPEVVRLHVAYVVVAQLWKKRGYNPGSAQDALIEKDATDAFTWLREAADSKEGLIELPLRADSTADGITKGGPLGYSEADAYEWTDKQAEARRGR